MYNEIGELLSPQAVALFNAAEEYVQTQVPKIRELGLPELPRWDYDQGTGEIVFSTREGEQKVQAQFQIVGSFSLVSHTWCWSWANETMTANVKNAIDEVCAYGKEHQIRALTEAQFPSTQEESWRLASVAAYLTKAEIAMHLPTVPGENAGFIFPFLSHVRTVG